MKMKNLNSSLKKLTPEKIVTELDKYIVGQNDAKKSVAIAIRNRWRRMKLPEKTRDEIAPKNIIMIGPTGVGKTEIARRMAKLVAAPFLKVEATKFTEVGYHGRDVESMIRDLVEISFRMVKGEEMKKVWKKAQLNSEEKILDALLPGMINSHSDNLDKPNNETANSTRETFRKKLHAKKLENRYIEININEKSVPLMQVFSNVGVEEMGFDPQMQNMLDGLFPSKKKAKKMKISDARNILTSIEAEKLVDWSKVKEEAIFRAENSGIIFIDEIDKLAGNNNLSGPDVSRGGVQRDLLPIVEGTNVMTRHGTVFTSHILFIAAGAFHSSSPNDLMPELQGRFPIRVELTSLNKEDFKRILTEPENSLTKQYKALIKTEGVNISYKDEAINEIAEIAEEINQTTQNIGARRLYTVIEKMFEDLSFNAPTMKKKNVTVDLNYVKNNLENIVKDEDLSKYIL